MVNLLFLLTISSLLIKYFLKNAIFAEKNLIIQPAIKDSAIRIANVVEPLKWVKVESPNDEKWTLGESGWS